MEEDRKRIYTVLGVVAAISLVLSCLVGALAGGLTGFLTGQRQAQLAQRAVEGALEDLRAFEMPFPMPEGGREGVAPLPPFEGMPSWMQGAIVVEVVPDTPAAEAGLREGDIIQRVDSVPIDRNHELPDVIGQYQPGDRVMIHFWRDGEDESVQVTLTANPAAPGRAYLGVYFQMIPGLDLQLPQD